MTDTERNRIEAICEIANVDDIGDVKQNKNKAWKSLRHEDGELCFGGEWFIFGIDTPEGSMVISERRRTDEQREP